MKVEERERIEEEKKNQQRQQYTKRLTEMQPKQLEQEFIENAYNKGDYIKGVALMRILINLSEMNNIKSKLRKCLFDIEMAVGTEQNIKEIFRTYFPEDIS